MTNTERVREAAEDLYDLSRLLEPGTQAEALCNRALAVLDGLDGLDAVNADPEHDWLTNLFAYVDLLDRAGFTEEALALRLRLP